MDRPPNTQLLQAHSGATGSKGSPMSLSFGKEKDQRAVYQAHCQSLLYNQTARFPKMWLYTNGNHRNTRSALQMPAFYISLKRDSGSMLCVQV